MVVTHGSRASAWGRATLTIGNFDGVHRGHRALIERVVAKGRELQVPSSVLTFEPHPREFFAPERAPARLTRLRDSSAAFCASGRWALPAERMNSIIDWPELFPMTSRSVSELVPSRLAPWIEAQPHSPAA